MTARPAKLTTGPAAVLFDLDGTLIDSEPLWYAEQLAVVERYGGVWTDEDRHALVGMSMGQSTDYLLTRIPLSGRPDASATTDAIIEGVVGRIRDRAPWLPGAESLLAGLAGQAQLALVTGAWDPLIEAVLRHLPPDTFSVIVGGQMVSLGKPDPEPYLAALDALGLDPADCLAVEDSVPGVRSARAAGLPTLAVPHIVPVAVEPGLVVVPSLAGVTPAALASLYAEARSTAGTC